MMDELCRLCASAKPFNRLTIRISDSKLNVEEKLIACCQWNKYKQDDDNLPDAICCECYDRLQECWLFSESIASAQEKLRRMLFLNIETARVKHELKTEDNEFNQCETESEDINIFVEPLTLPVAIIEPLEPPTNDINCDGKPPMESTSSFTFEVKKYEDWTRHFENLDEHQTTEPDAADSEPAEEHNELKYACEECDRRFRLRSTLNKHRSMHSKERPFECWLCHKTYKRRKELNVHIKMHRDFFDCKKCGKRFLKKSKRANHMEKRHGIIDSKKKSTAALKLFTCELCGNSYCQSNGLSRHLQTAHSDVWPHKCEVCGMGFKIKNGLNDHRKKHTEFQHKCKQCGKAFRQKISLKRHMEYHNGVIEKPFACEFCDKSFRLNFNLQEHRRIHTGEEPFSCEHCPSKFRTMSSFYSHLKKKHDISISARKQEERTRAAATP